MTIQLTKLTQITNLRDIWKLETDFSKWLAEEENLKSLSDTIGIELVLIESESSVGDFSVDLFAFEEGTNKKIVIENQLEDTDHKHLGQIITYAAGKAADAIVWIVKRARDEHRQAIEWLNQRTDENIGFFLVEIELWKIGDSLPAPRFSVVEKPNDWAKAMKTAEGLSDTRSILLEFWQAFKEHAAGKSEFAANFKLRKANSQHWYSLSIGSSEYHLNLTALTQKKKLGVEVYIPDNKELYSKLHAKNEEIARFLNCQLEWREADIACRILTQRDTDIKQEPSVWNTLFDWYCEMAIRFKQMLKEFDVNSQA